MRSVVSALAVKTYRFLQRHSSMFPVPRRAASFLLPVAAFHQSEAPTSGSGDIAAEPPSLDAVAGKRVLCLVEANADTTIMRRYFTAAATVHFVLQSEHASVATFIARQDRHSERFSAEIFDNVLSTGSQIEQECSRRNFEYFMHLTGFFESALATEADYSPHPQAMPAQFAGFIEPLVYYWCFVVPKTLESLLHSYRPDAIILLCRTGGYFGRLLPYLEQSADGTPLLIGYSHMLAQKRRDVFETVAGIVNYKPSRSVALSAARCDRAPTAAPDPGLALIMRQMQAAADLTVWRQAPAAGDSGYGAVTTTAADHVSYNYKFRQQLLERLARRFNLHLFVLESIAEEQWVLHAELLRANANGDRQIELKAYSPTGTALGSVLAEYLDRQRHLWQAKLVELAGGDWVLAIFDTLIFEPMVAKVLAGLEYVTYLRALMRRCPPAFALSITGETSRTALLLAAAEKCGVPTFDMQVVATNDDPRNRVSLLPKADHYFAMDVQSADLLAAWGWNPDRLYLTGTVRFDQLQALNTADERKRARASLLEGRYRHLIVFISQTLSYDYCRMALEVVAEAIGRRPDTKLLVKLHPREPEGNRTNYQNILMAAAPGLNWQVTDEVSVEDAMLASDLVVGFYSLALLEAACLRRPVIAANLSGIRLPEPTNFSDRGCILGASTAAELTALIASVLDDAAFRSRALARQEDYFRQHSYMVDRGALERIGRTIEEVVEGRPVSAQSLTGWRRTHGQAVERNPSVTSGQG